MTKIIDTDSKGMRYALLGILGVLIITFGLMLYPGMGKITGKAVSYDKSGSEVNLEPAKKSPKEYYEMFKCSCCGQSIAADCCEIAEQRQDYVDKLLLEGVTEDELMYQMVKKFGADVLMDPSDEQRVRQYISSQASENSPKIEIENPQYDFGTVSQTEGSVSTTFTVKNTGKSDLIIEGLDTSCMCVTASMVYKGEESPIFGMGMHGGNPEDYRLTIPPGDSAQLRVYYDPMAHGVQKEAQLKIVREVTVISNDPYNFQQKVRIDLVQVP